MSGRKQQTSATLLQPGHDGEPPPRPANLLGGPRAEGIAHDSEVLPVVGGSPGAGKPAAGALAGTARGPRSPGMRSARRSARGIQQRGHPGVLANPSDHGFTNLAARRVIALAIRASTHVLFRHAHPTTGARSGPAAPVMRNWPASAAVRSRVSAAGRHFVSAQRAWCRCGVLTSRRRRCRRWPDHRGPEGVGRPRRPSLCPVAAAADPS